MATETVVNEDDIQLSAEEQAAAAKAEDRLAALQDDGTPDPDDPDSQAASQPVTKKATPAAVDGGQAADGTGGADGTPADETELVLPDKYYRAAIHQGWTPEDIQEFFESAPEKSLKTFERLYQSTNRLSSEFSRLGRQNGSQTAQTAQPASQPVSQPASRVSNADWKAIEAEYGAEDPLVKMLKTALENPVYSQQRQQVEWQPEPQQNADPYLRQQIDEFWSGNITKPYKEFYGDGVNEQNLTLGQNKNRWNLLKQADEIMSGAQLSGRRMDPTEALERAHLILTDTMRVAAVRKELVAKVKVKANGITLKPKHQAKPVSTGPATADELEDRAAKRLAAVKW